jgi:kynurenine formamidase
MAATAPAPAAVLRALAHAGTGRVYDLDCGRWHGMPVWPGHPPFQLLTYRTPRGVEAQGDHPWLAPNDPNYHWHSEMIIACEHSGTHVDALGHVCHGPELEWHGGGRSDRDVGDFGLLRDDAEAIPPFVARGVLIDVPGHRGIEALAAGEPVGREEVEAILAAQGTTLEAGDIPFLRTGYLGGWPDPDWMREHGGAGLDLDAAIWLADHGTPAIGGDTDVVEVAPATVAGHPAPVHAELLITRGIHLIELVNLEALARDGVHEFCFVCTPPRIRGATGSMVRPIAIA